MVWNTTNITTSPSFGDIYLKMNQAMNNWVGINIMIMTFLVSIIILSRNNEIDSYQAYTLSSAFTMLISLILFFMQFFDIRYITIPFIMTIIGIIVIIFKRSD